jgi:hypothetical protein
MADAFFAQAGSVCWMTPPEVVEVARETFGGSIDLDPCAPVDTRYGHATLNWRLADGIDCLKRLWGPRRAGPTKILVNPPFGTSYVRYRDPEVRATATGVGPMECVSAKQMSEMKKAVAEGKADATVLEGWWAQHTLDFAQKVIGERNANRAHTVWISKGGMETEAIQLLLECADAYCLPGYRVAYVDPESGKKMTGATFHSVLFYLGDKPGSFCAAAGKLGFCAQLSGRRAA